MANYNKLNLKGFEIPLLDDSDTTTYPRISFKKDDKIYNASINVADSITSVGKDSIVVKIKDKIFYGKKKSTIVYSVVLPADCSNYMKNTYPSTYQTITEVPDEMKTPDTSNVTDMYCMFQSCKALTVIPQLNTSKVTNMSSMFGNCYAIKSIPQLDTSKVTNMGYMFSACKALTTIPQLNTSKVVIMHDMFNGCNALTSIPQLDTSKVISMYNMFNNCISLTSVPQLDTSKVTNMNSMFSGCPGLTTIPQLDTSKVTDMTLMFSGCSKLPTVFPWTIDCTSIIYIDNVSGMFNGSSVKEVTFKNVNASIKSQFTAAKLGSQLNKIVIKNTI